jgi:hypothetical protein
VIRLAWLMLGVAIAGVGCTSPPSPTEVLQTPPLPSAGRSPTPIASPSPGASAEATALSEPSAFAAATATALPGGCELEASGGLGLEWKPGGDIDPYIQSKIETHLATTYAGRDVLGERRIRISSANATVLIGKDVVVVRLGQDLYPTVVGPQGLPAITVCSLSFYNATTGKWLTTYGESRGLPTPQPS